MVAYTPVAILLVAILSFPRTVQGLPSGYSPKRCADIVIGRSIYITTNDQDNGIVALRIGKNGMLSSGSVTLTGGNGGVSLHGDGTPAGPDALISQSALTRVGRYIFAVNAGSNSLSMLVISKHDPTHLTLVGDPVAVPGEFPNTIAASLTNHLVCVGMTGSKAGISCGNFSEHGLSPMDELRPFALGQTTPPVGPTNTVSHTFFSEDQSLLYTTVKGDPATNKTGFFSVFPVQKSHAAGCNIAKLSRTDTRSVPEGTAVLFGSQVISETSNVFATDPSFGAAILSVDPTSYEVTTAATGRIEGQAATCWSTISPFTNTAFVTDVAINRIIEMSLKDASVVSEIDLSSNGDIGLVDLQVAGNFLYALSPGNGTSGAAITVVDLSNGAGSGKMVQHFILKDMAGKRAAGMTVLL